MFAMCMNDFNFWCVLYFLMIINYEGWRLIVLMKNCFWAHFNTDNEYNFHELVSKIVFKAATAWWFFLFMLILNITIGKGLKIKCGTPDFWFKVISQKTNEYLHSEYAIFGLFWFGLLICFEWWFCLSVLLLNCMIKWLISFNFYIAFCENIPTPTTLNYCWFKCFYFCFLCDNTKRNLIHWR